MRFLKAAGLTLLLASAAGAALQAPQKDAEENDQRNMQAGFVDTGPGKLAPLARTPGDAIDAADMGNLLDRRTEAAIKRGLEALKRSQQPDGGWAHASDQNREAYAAFAMIAYMMNGHFADRKQQPYGEVMERAQNYLIRENRSVAGYIGNNMYAHGLATVALSEVWGHSTRDEKVHEALKAAVKVILNAQNRAGGWRYDPVPFGSDVSVTAMQVVALASARQAGIFVPDETINRAVRYVTLCHQATDGGFSYNPGPGLSAFARTAAACTSMMMLGRHDAPEVNKGIEYIRREAKKALGKTDHWSYAMYYATVALYISSPEDFQWWYPQIRDVLLAKQLKDGAFGGDYDTSIALVILSMPYGFVPAYQR